MCLDTKINNIYIKIINLSLFSAYFLLLYVYSILHIIFYIPKFSTIISLLLNKFEREFKQLSSFRRQKRIERVIIGNH